MFPTILKIRLLQSLRIIQNIGWLRMLAFVICVVPFIIRYFAETWYLLIVSSLFLGLIHFVRTDKKFIKILQLSVYQVYAIEYSIFLLPVWIFLLVKQEFLYFGGSIAIATIISAIPYTIQQQNRPLLFVSRWIPAISFEWKSGFRQHFPFIAIFSHIIDSFLTNFRHQSGILQKNSAVRSLFWPFNKSLIYLKLPLKKLFFLQEFSFLSFFGLLRAF
jgi:hypothetical protein